MIVGREVFEVDVFPAGGLTTARISTARAAHESTSVRGGWSGCGTTSGDEFARRFRRNGGISAVGIGADGFTEFLVEWCTADQDDEVVAQALLRHACR